MDLIGHCAVAALSGLHSERELFGPGIVDLMLPNILHCHDWGYQHLWDIGPFDESLQPIAKPMRTHIIADWIVHYGDKQTSAKRKQGWAYRHMGPANLRSRPFFEGARIRGLLRSDATGPDKWSKKRKLDFAHSIMEYALDFILAPEIMSASRLADVRRHLGGMTENGGSRGIAWLGATARAFRVETDQPYEVIRQSLEGLAHDAGIAREPEAFAVSSTLRKYGFYFDQRSANYVRTFIDAIAADLDTRECRAMCASIAKVISDPTSILTEDLAATNLVRPQI